MSSTSSHKKDIVDFLWEWASVQGDWAKKLVDQIVSSEDALSVQERQKVFQYFLQSINLHSGLQPITLTKPKYTSICKEISLSSLSEITGVNKLAAKQVMNFSKNLTVIYGENGTGKTGYGRVLKKLGFSYDTNSDILSNVTGVAQNQSAKLDYTLDVQAKTFKWDGSNTSKDLSNISVFNNDCVQISLKDRQLIVSPVGFHLFNLITDELNDLSELLLSEQDKYKPNLSWALLLKEGTPQKALISDLSFKTKDQDVKLLSKLELSYDTDLKKAETDLTKLNKPLIETKIQTLNQQKTELNLVQGKIEDIEKVLTPETWNEVIRLKGLIKKLEGRTKIGIKEIADKNGVKFYESPEFEKFIKSAEAYVKKIDKADYPSNEDVCIYCQQPLKDSSKELLASYRGLLNDNTQELLESLKSEKKKLIDKISSIGEKLIFHQGTFGLDDDKKAVQPVEIIKYNKQVYEYKKLLIEDKIDKDSKFDLDYDKVKIYLKKKCTSIDSLLMLKNQTLNSLSQKEKALKMVIEELKDRKLLSDNIVEITDSIESLKKIESLSKKGNSFKTIAISKKTTEARKELVNSNFEEMFNNELKQLRKTDIHIDLGFGTSKGKSKIVHKIKAHALAEILSEGEQKTIALAEFLTELQLDNIKAPVVFDDPVNSLDHLIIDDVAKRLIKLSGDRQVIVFTHSILLFNSFLYLSKLPYNKELNYEFYNTIKSFGETGILSPAKEKINSPKDYIKKINSLLSNAKSSGKSEGEIAQEGYGFLRSGLELLIEINVFQGTVKRFQKNVSFGSFAKVNGKLLDEHKEELNGMFDRSCGYINGHSDPEQVSNTPTIAELSEDSEEFEKLRKIFNN